MINVIIFIIILGLLVLVHELGHFITAKRNGILVEEFGFGLPPRVLGVRIKETLYSLNLLPIGGFVKLYGEEYQEIKKKVKPELKKKAFAFKKPWQKAVVVISGSIGNFLLGWVLISFLFTRGVPTPTNKVIIEKVQPNSPAAYAFLKEKDVILRLNNQPIKSTNDFVVKTKKFLGQKITLSVEREGKEIVKEITPRVNPPEGEGPLGVVVTSFIEKKYPWYQAPLFGLVEAVKITSLIIREIFKIIYQLITFQKPKVEVSGPVGIARYASQAIKFGQNAVLELIALLSLNLAVINILPFPALDGGRLIFVLYEWLTKKKVNEKIERYLNLIGFVVLISLAILITINDIIRIYK